MNKLKKQALLLLCATLSMLSSAVAYPTPPTEYEVKAGFIHNIVKLVEWPVSSIHPEVLKFCILGQNSFGRALEVLQGKEIDGMRWEVVLPGPKTNLKECRVLFISASEAGGLRHILDSIRGSAILTVGDTSGYAEQGMIVNFYLEEDRVRFEINKDAAKRSGLSFSSQLLKLARIVQDTGGVR